MLWYATSLFKRIELLLLYFIIIILLYHITAKISNMMQLSQVQSKKHSSLGKLFVLLSPESIFYQMEANMMIFSVQTISDTGHTHPEVKVILWCST